MLETLSLMGAGFINAATPVNLIAMVLATTFGLAIGCLPGLSAAMGVALLLPGNGPKCPRRYLLRRHFRRIDFSNFDSYTGNSRLGGNGNRRLPADTKRACGSCLDRCVRCLVRGRSLVVSLSLLFLSPLSGPCDAV